MSFPTTPQLTAFPGADESPLSESGKWAGPMQNVSGTQMRLVSNAAKAVGASGQSYRTDISATDLEVFTDITTLPTAGNGGIVMARIQNPNTASATEYIHVWINGTGYQFYKLTAGSTFTQLGSTTSTHTHTAGQSIGLSVISNVLTGYYGDAAMFSGVNVVATYTDNSSPITGAGTIGFGADESVTTVLDQFGGGAITNKSLVFNERPMRRNMLLRL